MTKEERSEYNKQYRLKNIERIKEKEKLYRSENKDLLRSKGKIYLDNNNETRKEYLKGYRKLNKINTKNYNIIYRENNKEKITLLYKNWVKTQYKTPLYRIKNALRTQIRRWLKIVNGKKTMRTHETLGCNYVEFKEYLESKFEPWMNWDNYGRYNGELNYGWDIDHITPLATAMTEDDVIRLNHYTNLQPLCSYTNRYIKRDNIL